MVRKQILVLQCSYFLRRDAQKELLDRIRKEMNDGLVFLPPGITATTVNMDDPVMFGIKAYTCPGCGAPVDPYRHVCDYCGTQYTIFRRIEVEEEKAQ